MVAAKAIYLGILMMATGLLVASWGFGMLRGVAISALGAVLLFMGCRDFTRRRQ